MRWRLPSSSRTLSVMCSAMKPNTSIGMPSRCSAGLLLEDCDTGFEFRRLDVGDEAPLEAAAQSVLELGQRLRRPVGADHDLPAAAVQVVEGVEELLLQLLGALEELDVVDQQYVDVAVTPLECHVR